MTIVSMTSWKKRINHIAKSIFMMYSQTVKPDKIYLTLSSDEFPNKEKDLPDDLIAIKNSLENFELIWVKENTKAFKKLIPVLSKYQDQDCWICTIDDDVFYEKDYLETILKYAKENFGKVVNPRISGNWLHGAFGCYHTSYFKNKNIFKLTTKQMIDLVEDDAWYRACYHENNIGDIPITELKNHFIMNKFEEPLSKTYGRIRNTESKIKQILKS